MSDTRYHQLNGGDMQIRIRPYAAVLLALAIVLASCASNPRARVVTAYQSLGTLLGALQDAERAAYASGTVAALTKEVHEQKISPAFVRAFDMQIKVGDALLVWKPGTALPVGYDQWVASVENVAQVVSAVTPQNKSVADATVAFVRAAVDAIRQFGQQPPPTLLAAANQPQ